MPDLYTPNCLGPIIILVRPQLSWNIGMAARAMLNCGLESLRLVAPRDGWSEDHIAQAADAASGATPVIEKAVCFPDLASALADCQHVWAVTARLREMALPVYPPGPALQKAHTTIQAGQQTAFLFGAERTGLTNDEVARAGQILDIPLNPQFKSLNLAHAVLLICYEFHRLSAGIQPDINPLADPAPQAELDNLITRLLDDISAGGFFKNPDMKPTVARNLRILFNRAQPSQQEINTLHGIVRALRGLDNRS